MENILPTPPGERVIPGLQDASIDTEISYDEDGKLTNLHFELRLPKKVRMACQQAYLCILWMTVCMTVITATILAHLDKF